ncbi:MAG: AMP-dependent synthetase/ligase [Candidatus Acidiferrales bacterium]
MAYPSLTQSFLDAVDKFQNPRAQVFKSGANWEAISAGEMLRRVAGLSNALSMLGIKTGDRVALFAANCPEWHIVDFAVNGLGAATVPIYFNESPERIAYILGDSGARVIFAVGAERVKRILSQRSSLPSLEQIIAIAAPEIPAGDALQYDALISTAGAAEISEYRRRAADLAPSQLATIIYTSGTTGEPKGVMLSHSNFTSNVFDASELLDVLPGDLALSFLPLAHVYERTVDYGYLFKGVSIAYLSRIEEVQQVLLEVHPTIMAAVPRFFEKTYANILEQGHRNTGLKRKLFDWTMRVAEDAEPWRTHGQPASLGLRLSWGLADKLVYAKIRAGLGGRIRRFVSGGAPLSKDLAEFFWSIGIAIYQGYGLTETSPVVSTNYPGGNIVGTVGRPIPNAEVRIAEDGEILVRGPLVMQGYYKKPAETAEVLGPDGWFRTGDIGLLDEDGYLVITDRKKELLKTAAGKFVAPQLIENRLKTSPFILNAAAVGDKRKFISVLIVPNFGAVESQAREERVTFSSREELARSPWLHAFLEKEMERLTASLAQYERPKRFAVIADDFTFANGLLTYTMKLKRRAIDEKFGDVIENLYADVEEPRPHLRA